MLEQARLKVEQQAIKNIQFLEQDLPKNPLEKEFDCLAVSRLLHHMPDLDADLSLFHQHLKEDRKLIIADFTKTEANHHGFDLAELENKLIEHGFSSVHSQILYSAEDLFQGNHSEFFLTVSQKSLA
ncbi:methyltransferase small domain superfamily [Streptococcus pneumoniae]|nr:methyltransferase small domain superfamily [Streptococcus pneumoniae]CEY82954.1 methyltransferase small domain superfamily [Streptococcus pneumoniae]CIP19100.1 methyltransferase small domain superfamily [Streptococcus pneumoniae]CIP90372.1 methyltransferase small domain superfamily [Streptococcus pneumoniae]CIP94727.1 methyltransferase small domain superfamily [Streptococcus pneumoniae]